uniref:Uncharacterized protein n=1 Tax=Lactuca sativa TaxID=4236 RepID=A0A9R1X7Z8_LACSA|nr:hypothetical protein LSAT_V11C600319150 [Lactuca sativa]
MVLHVMLKTAKSNMVKTKNFSSTTLLLSIREGGLLQPTLNPLSRREKDQSDIALTKNPQEVVCFHCKEIRHRRRSFLKYTEELNKLKSKESSSLYI